MSELFRFGRRSSHEEDECSATLPSGCETREELFDAFKSTLGLPEYFGGNWDALSECLRDLSWISQHTVVLIHTGRPLVSDDEFRTYIDVLRECITDWKEGEEHSLIVVFPEELRSTVSALMN